MRRMSNFTYANGVADGRASGFLLGYVTGIIGSTIVVVLFHVVGLV